VPYRLRLYGGDRLLATVQSETTQQVGQRLAEALNEQARPELEEDGPPLRWEVSHTRALGPERPLSPEEEGELFAAMSERHRQIRGCSGAPLPRSRPG
jgi:hypothetical protein